MNKVSNYAAEVLPAALFAAPTTAKTPVIDGSWKATSHRVRVVGTAMKDAFIGQARQPRGIPL